MGVTMRLQIVKSPNATNLYIVRSKRVNGKNTNEVVESLGNVETLKTKLHIDDPIAWGKDYAKRLTLEEEELKRKVMIPFNQSSLLPLGEQVKFNGGYLFLQRIWNMLQMPAVCKAIKRKHKFSYDLNSILSRLIYCRITNPSSKLSTFEFSKTLLEKPKFDLHQIYRALDVIAEEAEYIQERLYKISKDVVPRDTSVLYYDCTNYFFEIEEEKGSRKFGHCKEGRPLPIVQMGLFMDGSGIPLAFNIFSGNENEKKSMKPLESKILEDFGLSSFIICTDSALSSATNKYFNSREKRNFISTTSLPMMAAKRRDKILKSDGWKLVGGGDKLYDINNISEEYYEKIFYKEEWFIDELDVYDDSLQKMVKRDVEQRLVVTYSLKYRDYTRKLREGRIERAIKLMGRGKNAVIRKGNNDVRKYIKTTSVTNEGEVAENIQFDIDSEAISKDEQFDGFYAVYTSLDQFKYPIEKICSINKNRWEIEESFRIMKSEFKARPVYLQRDNRIKAHFTTCFIALMFLRILEKTLKGKYTYTKIIDTLSDICFCKIQDKGYIPAYTRSDITDALHEAFHFRTDFEIISDSGMKKIFAETKKSSKL